MKTFEELYKEVMASDELKKEFIEAAANEDSITAWLKKHDCDASADEIKTFLKEKYEGEMNDETVEAVAGGKSDSRVIFSIGTLGIGCAVAPASSAAQGDGAGKCFDEASDEFADTIRHLAEKIFG